MDSLEGVRSVLEMFGLNSMIMVEVYIFIITMGQVYFFGKMMNLVKKDRPKNIIAFITIAFFSLLYTFVKYGFDNIVVTITKLDIESIITLFIDYILCVSFAIVIYVLVGFKLYNRIDDLFDRKVGKD